MCKIVIDLLPLNYYTLNLLKTVYSIKGRHWTKQPTNTKQNQKLNIDLL